MTSESSRPSSPRPVVLCILDGWGYRIAPDSNAIAQANTPVWDRLMAGCPQSLLDTSGTAVGLPDGQMGNSEVGHMNIGAGRVVLQDLPRIDRAVEQGELAQNQTLQGLIERLRKSDGTCHLMGLVSPGGVHSHQDHMVALARIVTDAGVPVAVHAFLDGRDTPPRSAADFVADMQAGLPANATIATISGRYYTMDRDKRWDRVERAYDVLVDAEGRRAGDALAAIKAGYAAGESDEFVEPTAIGEFNGMQDGDGLLMANFRADRAREILTGLLDPAFDGFSRNRLVDFATACGMVSYSTALDAFLDVLFPPVALENVLGQVVAKAGLKQLRIAETEKYAHVTFFLNGGEEQTFDGEDRVLIPSPKVATYDLQPEMSAPEVTEKLTAAIGSGEYDLIVVNYANPDMVGHTGIMPAAISAVECIDACLGHLEQAVVSAGGVLLVTADHGNIEQMSDAETEQAHTAHTTNPVPLVLVGADNAAGDVGLADGKLCDVAPTLLTLLGLETPQEMSGHSLLSDGHEADREASRASA